MRELKLKYIIELLSDIGSKSNRDAQALTDAQKRVQQALKDTNQQVGLVERALLHMGGVGSASAQRQADYLAKLALRYHDVRRAAEGAYGAMHKVGQLTVGAGAAAYAADRLTRTPMEYSQRLAMMANTAFSDRNVAGRLQGKATLDAAISAAIRTAGGKRDDAAGALDFLIASGTVSPDVAMRMLPMVMKASTASGATPEALAGIGIRGMQSFGLSVNQIPEALNMALVAGQAGGFELRDMAKWLPQAMAAGHQSGLSGIEGMRRIIASMQASVITAGSKDEAGNNVVNLLAKINSQDTANDLKKLGVDLPAELAKARGKGVNSLDAFVGLVDKVAGRDPQYVALQKKLAGTTDRGERQQMLQSMADILQGKAVGKVIQDRQALMALVGEMNNRGYVRDVMARTRGEPGAMDAAFGVMSQESEYKRQQMLNEGATAVSTVFDKLKPALDGTFNGASKLAQEFPMLTAAVVAATGAISVATAGLVGGAAWRFLGGAAAGAGGAGAAAKIGAFGGVAARGGLYGLLAGEVGAIGYSLYDYYQATHREGVKLAPVPLRGGHLPLGAGSLDTSAYEWLGGTQQRLGEGRLAVDVRVSDERATATTTVTKPLPIVRIDAGNTNPAGYGRP